LLQKYQNFKAAFTGRFFVDGFSGTSLAQAHLFHKFQRDVPKVTCRRYERV